VGCPAPDGPRLDLGTVKQPSGKMLTVFAVAADLDVSGFRSNTFTLEWPKGSGRLQEFPELDRVAWLGVPEARVKLLKGQQPFLDRLATGLAGRTNGRSAGQG
jgi:predicted NUDIX family NTP pyrophosphohydrolase